VLADEFELCEVERVEFPLEVFLVSEAVGLTFERFDFGNRSRF
jgi:hypothetical protein